MDYFELECAVEEWAKEKGILDNATTIQQAIKTQEELIELLCAIDNDDREEIIDAIGTLWSH